MDIAIIEVSLKLPNINSLDDLYNSLKNKKDCLVNHPEDRFSSEIYYGNGKGKMNTKRGGYLKDIYEFDNNFFKFPKDELLTMDPQQRLLLELTYELIYKSNYNLNDLKNSKTGVFIGSCNSEYFQKQSEDPDYCNEYSITGGLLTLLSNRISYFYDLKGPSITIDTACSSSGNALHLACNSIKNGESDLCIVGGSNLILNPETTVGFSQGKFLSPDGKCKSFDNSANGYVRSEGIVLFMVKELNKAIKDNDKIYTIIKSTSVNQDGKTSSITVPNSDSQIKLMNESIKKSGIDVNNVVYIDAHGTGTKLGDKVESNSIGLSYGKKMQNKLNIGSIKTNIGHTEATSGLASICKIIVMMQNNEILPIINFNEISKDIDLEELNLNIVTESIKIEKEKYYMAINNYGFGGANFHCILEKYNNNTNNDYVEENIKNNLHLLCIYGNNENEINKKLINFLNYDDELFLKYLYNQNFNDKFNYAKIAILKDKDNLANYIFLDEEEHENIIYGKFNDNKPNICFVFCGQGPQFLEMGLDFMEDFPYFKEIINKCDNIWEEITGFSFIEKYGLFTKEFNNTTDYTIYEPIIAQPALTFFHIALFELYKYFGITPNTVIGHSAGEQASFYASGAISLKEAIIISYYRSINQQKTSGSGNMLAVNDSIKNIEKRIKSFPKLELAAINSDNSYVISGPTKYIDILQKKLSDSDILSVKIRGNCPFHSSYQDIIKEEIINQTKSINFKDVNNNIELISTVTGYNFDKNDYEKDYWWRNIREKVNFYEGIEQCIDTNIFIEIAPHKVLSNYVSDINKDSLVLQSANRKLNSSKYFLQTLVKLYFSGLDINFKNFGIRNNIYIPKHFWVKDKYYQEPLKSYNRRNNIIENPNLIINSVNKYDYVKDHKIGESAIVPTVYYIDIINKYYLEENSTIENLNLMKIYNLDKEIYLNVLNQDSEKYSFLNKNKEMLCNFEITNNKVELPEINKEYIDSIIENASVHYNEEQIYEILNNKNYNFGEKFRLTNSMYKRGNELITVINDYKSNNNLYPPALDCGLIALPISNGMSNNITYVPSLIEKIYKTNNNSIIKYVYLRIIKDDFNEILVNSFFYDSECNLVLLFNNLLMKSITILSTNIYEIYNNNISIKNKEINNDYKINKIEDNNLLNLRDELLLNKKCIYLIDISENYELVGFIRTIFNELDNVNFKVCYYQIYNENIQKLALKCNDLESFYDSESDKLINYKIKDYKNIEYNFDNYELSYSKKGTLDNLYFKNKNNNKLRNNEVEVEIKYSSINFKDIAVILNLVEDKAIGCEFSGIVTRSNCDKYVKGEEVFGTSPNDGGSITNLLAINEKYIWKKPENISLLEAGAFSLSYCTSYISLIKCAKITKDDTVLIHSASGALGLSCLEICKYIGCKVIVSTSNQEKRDYLENNYDFDLITDSRNPDVYKEDIMNFTNGRGVNVIISSTVGKSLQTNIEILSTFGRIVDLGKRHIYNKDSINVKDFLKSIQYYSVHFDKLLLSDNELIRTYMDEVTNLVNENKIKMFKINEYDISNYKDAFNSMSRSNQIGKIVLNISDYNPDRSGIPDNIFSEDKYYLITGGLGGLGSKLVDFMSKNGARKFLLTSRRDKYDLSSFNNELDINVIKTDLLNYNDLSKILENYEIDGVFHLAGMIKDKLAKDLEDEDIDDVLNIKKIGIQNLGKYFENKEHTYFIAFSSIVALIGNVSQSVYSGANSYMDEYCRIRNKNGLPALSINLGAIGGTGIIENNFVLGKTMKLNNIDFTHFENLFIKMKECMLDKNIYQVCITDQNWNNLNNQQTKYIFSNYIKEVKKSNVINIDKISEKIKTFLRKKLDQETIDSRINLLEYGIDSLLSMELANWFSKKLNISIKQIDILKGISLEEIINKYKNENKLTFEGENTNSNDNNNLFYFKTNNEIINEDSDNEEEKQNIKVLEKSNNTNYLYLFLPLFYFIYYLYVNYI